MSLSAERCSSAGQDGWAKSGMEVGELTCGGDSRALRVDVAHSNLVAIIVALNSSSPSLFAILLLDYLVARALFM